MWKYLSEGMGYYMTIYVTDLYINLYNLSMLCIVTTIN